MVTYCGKKLVNMSKSVQREEPVDNAENEEIEEDATSSTSRQRSRVWDYFDKFEHEGIEKARCTNCGTLIKTQFGTSNMRRHIIKCFNVVESDPPQKRIRLDQSVYRELVATSIIVHSYPFKYVEHKITRRVHKFLHPSTQAITRNTAKADVLKIYEREKMTLKHDDGYMALTAHYIAETWVIRKKVLNFRVIPPPHGGTLLAEFMINFLKDWGIEKKFSSHLSLNGGLLCNGDYMHVRCGAHVLNLIVQVGLKVIQSAIIKIRESVKYVRGSAIRKLRFAECIDHLSLQCGRHLLDHNFKTCPTHLEWSRVEGIKKFLKPFYVITTLFSGSRYLTSNLYFHNVWRIQQCIQEELTNSDLVIKEMAHEMKAKFAKYWENYSMILSFAIILDPRYKAKIVEYCFTKLGMEDDELRAKVESVINGLKKLYKEYDISSNVGGVSSKTIGGKIKGGIPN
ncbi:zinc finger BED domain-containing protein RICESLEEPER 2-like [Rutidosis leptorrhynchoides]|uniref:zinc finger BED domain-containing protein RICESLEEPER 2-like n=1 Tax=Rutidosis leptorrhynchoides TaxID=125765 RepID=UPI003A997452